MPSRSLNFVDVDVDNKSVEKPLSSQPIGPDPEDEFDEYLSRREGERRKTNGLDQSNEGPLRLSRGQQEQREAAPQKMVRKAGPSDQYQKCGKDCKTGAFVTITGGKYKGQTGFMKANGGSVYLYSDRHMRELIGHPRRGNVQRTPRYGKHCQTGDFVEIISGKHQGRFGYMKANGSNVRLYSDKFMEERSYIGSPSRKYVLERVAAVCA